MKKNHSLYGKADSYVPLKKILRTMKITLFIVLLSAMQIIANGVYSQNTRFNLAKESTTIENILNKIENQSEYYFLYNGKLVDVTQKVSIKIENQNLEKTLDALFQNTDIQYKIYDRQVVLSPSQVVNSTQQQKSVSGKVTDSAGGSLPGVSVIVKGTTTGVITDMDGKYTFSKVPENAALLFSFVGMKTQEIVVGGKLSINVILAEESIGLEEVVAVGYGTMKKSDLTGSVSRTSIGDKASLSTTNLLTALSGTSAGVNIQASGLAGSDPNLSIRGATSLSASDRPLIVLDGIIFSGDISSMNISDVESVDILKDASAAAVYGSRSANGVLLITTKKGKTEKPTISFNSSYGYQNMTNNPMKVMNGDQYAARLVDFYYQQSLYAWYKTNPTSSAGKPLRPDITDRNIVASKLKTQEERDNYLAGNEINWVDEVLRTAPIQNYNLSFSGKTERSNYFISGSYSNEEGIQKNDQFSRITLHSNIESKITEWLTIGLNTSYSFRDYSGLEAELGSGLTAGARASSPWANNKIGSPKYDMFLTGEAYMPYPLNNLYVDNSNTRNDLFMVGNAKITIPWVKGLTYEFNYSNSYSNRNNNTFYPVTTPAGATNKGQAVKKPYEQRNSIANNIVTYIHTFGNHNINATLLYSWEDGYSQSSTLNAQGFDNPSLGYNNMSLGSIATVASEAWQENSISYMARANYTYKNRYMLTGTVRRDGFSGFGPSNKFATFPSVSLGWVTTEESFLKDIKGLYLKLRASYGKNGNQGIGRYSSFSRMAATSNVFGSTTAIGVYPSILGNENLAWESTSSLNFGIDYGFLNHRISGSIEIYKATTNSVLVQRALPPTTGYSSVWANISGIENKGIELNLNTVNLNGLIKWTSNFNFSLNRDKISKLYGGENDMDIGNSWFVNQPINSIYDYQFAGGLWTEDQLYNKKILANWYPGQYKYVDQNKDGIIDASNDRKVIGYKSPNYRFSLNNTFAYKDFSLSIMINSIQGGNGYYIDDNAPVINTQWNSDNVIRVNASAVRPYWTPDNGVNNATGIYNTPIVHGGIYESRSNSKEEFNDQRNDR